MFKFLLSLIVVFSTFFSEYSIASNVKHDEQDLALSKRSFLISGAQYTTLRDQNKGVMTLCFKEQEDSDYEHTSLVFEMFLPQNPNQTYLMMIHYGRRDDCCGGGTKGVMIDSHETTLCKVHGGVHPINETRVSANFKKYASWFIDNDQLIKGFTIANNDFNKNYSAGNCVKYVKRIMENVGLQKVDFGFWIEKPSNLKILVDEYIVPRYDIKY